MQMAATLAEDIRVKWCSQAKLSSARCWGAVVALVGANVPTRLRALSSRAFLARMPGLAWQILSALSKEAWLISLSPYKRRLEDCLV